MNIIKSLLAISIIISVCIAEDVNISGTVTDTGGSPIAGAVVSLEKGGLSTPTGADGKFIITGAVGINNQLDQSLSNNVLAVLKNGQICITVAEKSAVEIVTYTLNGKDIHSINKAMSSGTHSIVLPLLGAGVYFHKIKADDNEFILKSYSIDNMCFSTGIFTKDAPSITLGKMIEQYFQIDDVIKAVKAGYLNYRITITNPDTSGIEIKMISQDAGTITDIDGNVYHAIRIGNQVWTVENLRTTKYNDGTEIPLVTVNSLWNSLTTPGYCYYNNTTNTDSIEKYGALYNWYAVDPANIKKITPAGWHVPTEAEWDTLLGYLIANGYNWDGTTTGLKIGKSMAAKTDWASSSVEGHVGNNLSTNNSSCFTALPGGCRLSDGDFSSFGNDGYWWSTSLWSLACAYGHSLRHDSPWFWGGTPIIEFGYSVRLVKD